MAPTASSLSLQLPTFTPLEPLTKGTNLPEVPPEELLPPPPPIPTTTRSATAPPEFSRPATTEASKPKDNGPAVAGETTLSSSPPSSPNKPASVRRFLSRVSLNSNFTDDKNSIISSGPLSPDGIKPKKKHWWSRSSKGSVSSKGSASSKRHSMMPAVGGSMNGSISSNGRFSPLPPLPPTPKSQPVSNMPPPPRLPDDMFGKDLSSMDDDMFSSFNAGSGDTEVKK